jgi:hypothetical protein
MGTCFGGPKMSDQEQPVIVQARRYAVVTAAVTVQWLDTGPWRGHYIPRANSN